MEAAAGWGQQAHETNGFTYATYFAHNNDTRKITNIHFGTRHKHVHKVTHMHVRRRARAKSEAFAQKHTSTSTNTHFALQL